MYSLLQNVCFFLKLPGAPALTQTHQLKQSLAKTCSPAVCLALGLRIHGPHLSALSLSEASLCSPPLQPWSVGNFSMQLLDPLVTLPQPNDTTHWLLVTFLTLLWLKATMGSVLSFSAHSAELSRFCLLFQLHFVAVYSAVSADSCLASPTPLCGCRFAVGALALQSRCVTTTRSAVWALCHIRYFPSRVLLTVSLCLVHAGVPTSLNSVARLLLNAVYRLVLNVSDASVFSACLLHVWACMKALWTLRFCIQVLLSRDPATSSGPYCGFNCIFWILCTCLSTVHPSRCSDHSARVVLHVRVLTPVPFESLTHVVVTRQCFLPLVHDTGTCSACCTICVSPDYQHINVHAPCTVAVKLRQSVAPSGCSCRCDAPVCWRLLTCIPDCLFGQTFCNLCLLPESFKLQWRVWHTVLHCVTANSLDSVAASALECGRLSALRHAAPESAVQSTSISVGHRRTCWYAGSPHQFSSTSAELARQLSVPRYSARISSMRVTRFLFTPSQNPSDVAFKLFTMLTFLNTVSFLIVSPSNFAISSSRSSLHTLTSTPHEASSLLSTPSLGTLRFSSPHSLAPQASSLLLDVTPIRHFVHVVRSLTTPWKSQRLPQRLSSSVSVSLFRTHALRIWTLTSVLHPTPHCHHRCTYNLNCWHPSHAEVLTWIIQMFLGIDGLMSFTSSMNCIWCTVTVFIRILNHAPLLPTTLIGSCVLRNASEVWCRPGLPRYTRWNSSSCTPLTRHREW